MKRKYHSGVCLVLRCKPQGQKTIFDSLFEQKKQNRTRILDEIVEYLDFEIFRPTLESAFSVSVRGPLRFDPVVVFKILILQKWFNLSDPEVEAQIYDRFSFRRFLSLSLEDAIPDETTICRFRKQLKESEKYDWLFEILNQELERRHVKVKSGTLVDATFIEAPRGKRKNGEKTDPGADFGHKGHGYSMHTNIGKEDKLIHEVEMTSARPHDSKHFEDVLIGDEEEIWADSAYRSAKMEKQLKGEDVKSQINEKGKRNKPLTEVQKESNRVKSKVRSRVEHCYAQMKTHDGFIRTRYYGLKENRTDALCHAIAYNLRRGVFLLKEQIKQTLKNMKDSLNTELALTPTRETCV
jgi:IS5 family transposase